MILQGMPFQPGNPACLRLFTTTVRFHHAWPGTHEQPLHEKLWQLSLSGHGRSQWELTAGNVIATLYYYAKAASANTGWIACPQWLPFRLKCAAKRICCNAFLCFFLPLLWLRVIVWLSSMAPDMETNRFVF